MSIASKPRGACAAAAVVVSLGLLCTLAGGAGSDNGAAGQIPAFYEGRLFTINDKELPANASAQLIARGQKMNEIYATNDLDEEQDFAPVIDALPGDAFNPLWRQILIHFNPGATPHQFVSEDEVEDAALDGEITLEETDEVYRCSVVGAK
jgi:hypothetical protein